MAPYRALEYNVPPFWRIGQDGHFGLLIGSKNTSFVNNIDISIKFRWIPFSRVEIVSANQRPGQLS